MPRISSPVKLFASERVKLEPIAGRPKSSQRYAKRVRIILFCAAGKTNVEIAALTGTCVQTGGKYVGNASPPIAWAVRPTRHAMNRGDDQSGFRRMCQKKGQVLPTRS